MTAVEALLAGLVDYAGLFPPAALPMRKALDHYARYREDPASPALGRFIVPVARLDELETTGHDLLPRGTNSDPWRLSVLVGDDVRAAGDRLLKFNCHHWSGSEAGHAVVDVVELKAVTAQEIASRCAEVPKAFTPYVEIPVGENVGTLVKALSIAGARAKIRTGGTTRDAFPEPQAIVAFLSACLEHKVAFKATAGLHHPLRAEYPLTYEARSDSAVMYGFLNVFLAAAFLKAKADAATALGVLGESDPESLRFEEDGITWRQHRLTTTELSAARKSFAVSFGSCSFREPVDEFRELQLARAN
ncbi:MAG TPA: hypothetical protein VNJ04_20980 [Gemmatimonadaceae bacterium]|nr:hypothetical protein [Gemmatimonadaceae bacterium]